VCLDPRRGRPYDGVSEQHDVATVNLSQPVMVGSTTLPGGHYTIVDEGNNLFLVRSDNGDQALVFGRKIEESKQARKPSSS